MRSREKAWQVYLSPKLLFSGFYSMSPNFFFFYCFDSALRFFEVVLLRRFYTLSLNVYFHDISSYCKRIKRKSSCDFFNNHHEIFLFFYVWRDAKEFHSNQEKHDFFFFIELFLEALKETWETTFQVHQAPE